MKKLGLYFKKCREENGITQKTVATHLGYTSSQFISNVERGVCKPPAVELYRYSKFVGADRDVVYQLMTGMYNNRVRKALKL